MKRIRRLRPGLWLGLGVLIVAWAILGAVLRNQFTGINEVFDGASVAAFAAALAFVAIYTVAGVTRKPDGPPAWWQTTIGTLFVLAAVSVMLLAGPVAFAVLFHGGLINTFWWAWAWVGGHALAALVWLTFCWLRLIHPAGDGNGG